jgi:uncharacterized protein (TIGR03086 family)
MAAPSRGLAALDSAVRYALDGAALVSTARLASPTPCAGWTLAVLLAHLGASMADLSQVVSGRPDAAEPDQDGTDPVARLRGHAAGLMAACGAAGPAGRRLLLGDRELTVSMVTMTAAVEVAGHGWDIFAACGAPRPVPPRLAAVLLTVAPLLIPPEARPGLFGPPVPLRGPAGPGDHLVAFLGRQPRPAAAPPRRGDSRAPGWSV